jgi:hypothetical protein
VTGAPSRPRAPAAAPPPPTLADLVDHQALAAHCSRCQHSAALDLAALHARLGGAFPVPELRPLLRCTRCGHRGRTALLEPCSLTVSARTTSAGGPLFRPDPLARR